MSNSDYYGKKDGNGDEKRPDNSSSSYYDMPGAKQGQSSNPETSRFYSTYYDGPGMQPTRPNRPVRPENSSYSNSNGYNGTASSRNGEGANNSQNAFTNQTHDMNGESPEDHAQKHRMGLRGALRRGIDLNDTKGLPSLVLRAPEKWVVDEFKHAIKLAIKRQTAGELRRVIALYKSVSSTPGAEYMKEELTEPIERAERRLKKLEEWHKKLLQDWQRTKAPRTTDYVRAKEVREEKVTDVYRRHKIHILLLSGIPIAFFVLAFICLGVSAFFPPFSALFLVFAIIGGLWMAWTINDWANDYLMITNRRVMQYEKITFFKEDKKTLLIERVQQVRYEAKRGMFEFLFHIGNVTISGIGKLEINFDRVYMPDRIRKEINDAKGAYMGGRSKMRSARMENALRNKILGEPLRNDWDEEEIQVETLQRHEMNFMQLMIPGKPVDEGSGQISFRKHPIFLFKDWFKVIILYLILLPVGVIVLPILFGLNIAILSIIAFVLFVLVLGWNTVLLWYFWEDWYNDRYVLTNKDIIDIEKKPFGLDEEKSVIMLANVQDIELIQPGIIANFFDYGNVRVTTAGSGSPIIFRRVPSPDSVRAEIARRMETAKNIMEDNGDKLTLDYFAHYHKVSTEVQKSLLAPIYEKLGIDQKPPQS